MIRIKTSQVAIALLVLLWFLVASFGEYFCYLLAREHSVRLVPSSDNSKFLRILIVADPQIIGFNDAIFPINHLYMVDSDRFLRNSFQSAFAYDKPDMVIFLGDIFDEGRTAVDWQYKQYIQRFRSIFLLGPDIVKIHVPGDNDLGGGDSIDLFSDYQSFKFDRFANDREQFSRLSFDFIDFVKVNLLGHRVEMMNNRSIQKPRDFSSVIVTAISHLPLLDSPSSFVSDVFKSVRPNLILSAHTHQGALTFMDLESNSYHFDFIRANAYPIRMRLTRRKIVQITTPTCNYRMGFSETGYGSLLLEKINTSLYLQYTVLWNPRRYIYLYLYLAVIFVSLLAIVWKFSAIKSRC